MQKELLQSLKDKLEDLGFGRSLHRELERKTASQEKEFFLQKTFTIDRAYEPAIDKMETTLYFFTTPESSYDLIYLATLINEKVPAKNRAHLFKPTEDEITVKEAYNMLHGRPVLKTLPNKDGTTQKVWLQLDLKVWDHDGNYPICKYGDTEGYHLGKALDLYPIHELQSPPEKQALIQSLERGNRELVTLVRKHKKEEISIQANPRYKTIGIHMEHPAPCPPERKVVLKKHRPLRVVS